MKNSTAHKISQVPHRYLIMGIDPHKKVHVAVAMTQDTIIHTKFKFANSRQGYEQVMMSARDQMTKTGSLVSSLLSRLQVTIGEIWLTS